MRTNRIFITSLLAIFFSFPHVTLADYNFNNKKRPIKISDDISLVLGDNIVEGLIDGQGEKANLDTPRDLFVLADGKSILVNDSNGWMSRIIDDKKNVISLPSDETSLELLIKDHVISQVSIQDIKLTDNLFINRSLGRLFSVNSDNSINIVTTAMPIEVDEKKNFLFGAKSKIFSTDDGWIFMNLYKSGIYHLDKQGRAIEMSLPKAIKKTDLKNFTIDEEGNFWTVSNSSAYKLQREDMSLKILDKWSVNLDEEYGTDGWTDIAVANSRAYVIYEDKQQVVELLANGKTAVAFTNRCNIFSESGDICDSKLKTSHAELPSTIYFSGISRNPFTEGIIISGSMSNALFTLDNKHHMSRFLGHYPDSAKRDSDPHLLLKPDTDLTLYKGQLFATGIDLNSYIIEPNSSNASKSDRIIHKSYNDSEGHSNYIGVDVFSIGNRRYGEHEGYWLEFGAFEYKQLNKVKIVPHDLQKKELEQDNDQPIKLIQSSSDVAKDGQGGFYISRPKDKQLWKMNEKGQTKLIYDFTNFDFPPLPPELAKDEQQCECYRRQQGAIISILPFDDEYRLVDSYGFVYQFNPLMNEPIKLINEVRYVDYISSVAVDALGNIWFISNSHSLSFVTPMGKQIDVFKTVYKNAGALHIHATLSTTGITNQPIGEIKDLQFDRQGNLWLASQYGLYKVDKEKVEQLIRVDLTVS